MKKRFVIMISLSLLVITFVIAYYLVEYVPSKDKEQIITNLINRKRWNFSNKQYEFNISNINYFLYKNRFSDLEGKHPTFVVKADITLKNISIKPFIINGEINRCKVYNNDKLTSFYAHTNFRIEKGIVPGESFSTPIELELGGLDYDSSGNKLYPSTDLKVKSCELILATNNSQITHKNALTKDPVDADIEPVNITFP